MSTYFTKSSIKKALGGVMLKILHFLCAFKKKKIVKLPWIPSLALIPVFFKKNEV